MAYFDCIVGGSGKGNTLVVTCADDLAGATITCTNGTKTYTKTCPSTAPYEVTFYGLAAGTWTVSATVSGNTYTTTVVVVDCAALLGGFTWRGWVDSSKTLHSTDYNSLNEVLADEEALRQLFLVHDCVDYLAEVTSANADIQTIINTDLAAKWINLSDYALDTLYANTIIKGYMDTADKYFYGEWVITDDTTTPPTWGPKGNVPIMTANNAPYGECFANPAGAYGTYFAFNGTNSGAGDCWFGAYTANNTYIGYKFVNPTKVTRFFIENNSVKEDSIQGFKLQGSNDNSTWEDIGTYTNPAKTAGLRTYFDVTNDAYYLYYRLNITSTYSTNNICVGLIQFYGRELSVSVPVMTANNAPYGVASASSEYSDRYAAWKAFDGLATEADRWIPSDSDANSRLIYKFASPTCVRMAKFYNFDLSITCKIQGSNTGNSNDWHDLTNISSTIASSTWYRVGFDNDIAYKYYAVYMPNQQPTSQNRISIREVQFYGLDYSEKEFETGTTKKWLYDHGVELETLNIVTTSSNCLVEKENSQIHTYAPATQNVIASLYALVDTTSYNLLRAKIGDKLYCSASSGAGGWMGISSTTPTASTSWTSEITITPSSDLKPNEQGINISSVTGNNYVSIHSRNGGAMYIREATFKELWLE